MRKISRGNSSFTKDQIHSMVTGAVQKCTQIYDARARPLC